VLENLDSIPWADLEHAYGSAADVPDLLRQLLDPDHKTRREVMWTLYGNVFHQGTRYPATPFVIPFLIELCESSEVPGRYDLLRFWGSLITGYFSIQERPIWGDGETIYWCSKAQAVKEDDPYSRALHQVYRESLRGYGLLCDLLGSEELAVRAGAAWVLACLPTIARLSVPKLEARASIEQSGWVRAAIAFSLGELHAPTLLRRILTEDAFAGAQCMAACELARIEPTEALIEPLLRFVSEPIDEYENIPGSGGKSTGDAAFSVTNLPAEVQRRAIPMICDRLDNARSFDTMPLVHALLSAAFPERTDPITEPTILQRQVLARMVNTEELWSIGNLIWSFEARGLPQDRQKCAQLIGVKVADDEALEALRSGLAFADIGFLDKGREGIQKALELDPAVFERAPSPDECWLLCAKTFADTDPDRAMAAFRRATSINPRIVNRVDPTWRLADLLKEKGMG
jgi:tetratricopeptide (TPR) repeat protein